MLLSLDAERSLFIYKHSAHHAIPNNERRVGEGREEKAKTLVLEREDKGWVRVKVLLNKYHAHISL